MKRPSLLVLALSLSPLASAGCASDRSLEQKAAKAPPAAPTSEVAAAPSSPTLTLERVFSDPPLAGRPPMRVALSPQGTLLTYLKAGAEDSDATELWGLWLQDESAEPRPLVRAQDLVDMSTVTLSEEERMVLERKRQGHKGITSWSFCGADDRLLFPLAGDLYLVTLGQGAPEVRKVTTDGEAKLDARCSPKGTYAAYVKKGDLYLLTLATLKERRLTKGASATRSFGTAEFIAQEEMGRFEGYWFSPDERYLAYTEVDESEVSVKVRPFIFADRTEMFEQRYPAAGETNAKVTLRVRDLKSQRDVVVKTPEADGYLPRVSFFSDGRLAVQWQSRDQRRLLLYGGEAPAFSLKELVEEVDDAWVELHDDLAMLKDGTLVWSSERGGNKQLYLVRRDGSVAPLTQTPEPVHALCDVDETAGRVYFTAARERGREQHLFFAPLTGGEAVQVTKEPGWHDVTCKGGALVDTWSRWGAPPVVRLLSEDGAVRRALADREEAELAAHEGPAAEWLTLAAEDKTPLNGLLLTPSAPRAGKRPLLVFTYGGPTTNVVARRWSRLYPLFLHWTQRGYAVLLVDNRGTAYRERAFTRAFKDRFGVLEVADQKAAVRQVLSSHAELDEERVGIVGWSYGGYVTVMALLEEDTPFRAGAAVAPVTDWSLYDTHYTERYVGKPADNASVYERANALRRAKNLTREERALLLVHGMADDNVLFEHTLKLAAALQEEGAVFRLMPYPGHAHGIRGQKAQLHVWKTITRFFDDELAAESRRPAPEESQARR